MRRQPASRELVALIAQMRPDWAIEQITAEILGLPWSEHLAITAIHATRDDDEDQLRIAHAILLPPAKRLPVTQEQLDAYVSYTRKQLGRAEAADA
ncbi:hypothetical protein [Nonomuraea dietziae]|uniref:hypothetical protein n=1 Tax=Nonomuraea dietziae TaxID=65515 RepID=UPI0033E740BD